MVDNKETRHGYCKCGCGRKTNVPMRNCKSKNWIKGVPMDYCRGHKNKVTGIPDWQKKKLSEERRGSNNPNWKGNIYFDKHNGRWMTKKPNGVGYEMRAVKVLRDETGTEPDKEKDELVHHVNGDKTDDRIENLKIMTRSDHARLHILEVIKKTDKETLIKNARKGGIAGGNATKKKYGLEYYKNINKLRKYPNKNKQEDN